MKKNKKLNKILIFTIVGLILTISIVIFILNYSKDSSSLSIIEKTWINNNSSNVIDVSVYNDVPIYGQNGEGMIFSYLEEFTKTYNIEFNKVSYLQDNQENLKNVSFKILNYNETLTENDIKLYEDKYVIVSSTNKDVNDIKSLNSSKIAIFDNDVSNIKYFLNDAEDVEYITCKDETEILNYLNGKTVDYAIMPKNMYLDDILSNDLNIVYHLNDLYKTYVLTVKDEKTLKSIMNKFYNIYKEEYEDDAYQKLFLENIFKNKEITEAEQMNYNSSSYVYGYVTNMPYQNTISKEFVGTFSNYLSEFEDIADVDFKIVGYDSVQDLREALSSGEVDVAFADFNSSGLNIDTFNTVSFLKEQYIVLSKNNLVVNSIQSLKNKEVYTVENTYLSNYLLSNSITPVNFKNSDDLLRNINSNCIVILNMDTYEYYRDKKFADYNILYIDTLPSSYSFVIRDVNKNQTFAELFSFYISFTDYQTIKYDYHTDYILNSKHELSTIIKYTIIAVVSVLVLVIILCLIIRHNSKKKSVVNKTDKLKYIDAMTSLKNRNYLNYNIKKWEDNVIYPQAIIIIDLNNIKYINDNYGHVEGDEVIKKAASILIANQEENSDIIRTDGNEFLIYMVNYDEKQVIEYTRKLSKELKKLPHEFGATLGYSMILNNVKTIDDAINEATLSMRQAKEKL